MVCSLALDARFKHFAVQLCGPQDADPLGFWRDNSASSLLRPLLPLVASVSAVPATEAICERLFKAGGQALTSARLRLLGSRVEAVLMTNFNSQLADAARQESRRPAGAAVDSDRE